MKEGIAYLGTCYTSESKQEMVFRERLVSMAAAWLIQQGFCVYSPITYGARVEEFLPPKQHDFWMNQCLPVLKKCNRFFVLLLPGVSDSKGLRAELDFWHSKKREKPMAIVPCKNVGFAFAPKVNLIYTKKGKNEQIFYV